MEKERITINQAELDIPGFMPARVLDIELTQPLPGISSYDPNTGQRYGRAVVYVRVHGQPLGGIDIPLPETGLDPQSLADEIWQQLSGQINDHLHSDQLDRIPGLDPDGLIGIGQPECQKICEESAVQGPFTSIIVSTRDRSDSLRSALQSLVSQTYPMYEILVVDNAPQTDATTRLIQDEFADRVRYIREDQPGLAVARNAGVQQALGEILAFTDDDVVADPNWLLKLVGAFHCADDVACVTGMIFPMELETPAQAWFEEYGGFNKGYQRRVFDLHENRLDHTLYPYTVGRFGTGANMAFTADFLKEIGGFDPATGTGTPAMGGDDLAAFFEVIARGHQLVYEPAAVVYHRHRRDYQNLRRQTYGYGVGLTAYLMKAIIDKPVRIFSLAARIPSGLLYLLSPHSSKNVKKSNKFPAELNHLERKGMLYGPLAYLRSRWKYRRMSDTRYGAQK